MQEKYGPVGMLHLDAHPDTSETTFGERISNATPFRRAVEEGLLDCKRVVQIGLRGTGNSPFDYEFGRSHVSLSLLSFLRFCFCLQYKRGIKARPLTLLDPWKCWAISHFRDTLCLCFKTSSRAKRFRCEN